MNFTNLQNQVSLLSNESLAEFTNVLKLTARDLGRLSSEERGVLEQLSNSVAHEIDARVWNQD